MLVKERLVLKLGVRFQEAVGNYIARNTPEWLELAADGHHCAEAVALFLAQSPGVTGKLCPRRCAD